MPERPTFEVWITKYAASGEKIIHSWATASHDTEDAIRVVGHIGHYRKPHWHTTEAAAKVQANKMVQDKIVSLEKQLAKLRKLTF